MKILITIIATIALFMSTMDIPAPHNCGRTDCPHAGERTFHSEFSPDTDGYLMDLTHFQHPDWTWNKVELYVFG